MRLLIPSLVVCALLAGAALAQNAGEGNGMPQLPVGQSFRQFEFPVYQEGKLRYTLNATEAKGITLNRAEASDLKIQAYENGVVATTITSPKADLYVADLKMRTKNTVQIVRNDMEATSQNCDFDVKNKKYVLRTNVRVVLKHFDMSTGPKPAPAATTPKPADTPAPTTAAPSPIPEPTAAPAHAPQSPGSMPTSPGAYNDTSSSPIPPTSPNTK